MGRSQEQYADLGGIECEFCARWYRAEVYKLHKKINWTETWCGGIIYTEDLNNYRFWCKNHRRKVDLTNGKSKSKNKRRISLLWSV